MDCDDCIKIMCVYRGERKNCTETVMLKDVNTEKINIKTETNKIKEKLYFDFEGMR